MGVIHSIQLLWGLPWRDLKTATGHLGDDVPDVQEMSTRQIAEALDGLIAKPLRVRARFVRNDWSLGVFEAADIRDETEDELFVGVEVSAVSEKGLELLGTGSQMFEVEARRTCAEAHLQALGVVTAPQLLAITASG